MLLLQASTLSPLPPSLSSTKSSSLLFDPVSHSLALLLSDSSLLLFPSLSSPPLSIPPISTSFSFSSLNPNPNPNPTSLFFSTAPSPSSSLTLLHAWIRRPGSDHFSPIALSFKKEAGARSGGGLEIGLRHGFGVKIAGSVNVLVVHAAAEGKIWVMGLRMEEERVGLVKCAVIECTRPVFEVRVSMGVLVLGEVGGVRVFPLRVMVKGGEIGRRKKRNGGDEGRGHGKSMFNLLILAFDSKYLH